ncbi:MAG: 2-amino-4-hydroxy-6-hydroxymethyldihydropteridine diphosphokinase [Anaerolineae bacterium]|nr:2-amino-4-hydroxy-6-hydroxymethyldihydropteridine diphosphokinase [Anaerolineae bacterium]
MTDNHAYLVLGSNIEPEANLARALELLKAHCEILAVSPVYRTPPQGFTDQANFLNMALHIRTALEPAAFKSQVLEVIEQQLGRVRDPNNKNAPRTIDLDIALWNDVSMDYGAKPWHAPDRDIYKFAHVAVPLADIAPNYSHPESGETLAQIAARFDLNAMRENRVNLKIPYSEHPDKQ